MTQYINKAALVTEIERLISNGQVKLQESQESNDNESYVAWSEHIATCIKILSLLDTLEVKEVDLEKEIDNYIDTMEVWEIQEAPLISIENTAKHFFELGLKAQKGE